MTYDTTTLAIEAGKSTTLTCSVSNPDDLNLPVEVQWVKVSLHSVVSAYNGGDFLDIVLKVVNFVYSLCFSRNQS